MLLIIGCKQRNTQKEVETVKEIHLDKSSLTDKNELYGITADTMWKHNLTVFFEEHDGFKTFFEKYAQDSIFQKKHTRFPLKYSFMDFNGFGNRFMREENFTSINYKDYKSEAKKIDSLSPKCKIVIKKKKDTIFYKYIGIENGINVNHTFVSDTSSWYLIEIKDLSITKPTYN
ncbi:hypothetical protein DVK85_06960 [Flavobacterium arcticum]|uniref:DUF4348 domain-containing protein n=2 Tax=Flavobacterium arcticum TaxID=1784713 RepID=A0A345HBN6_9FLAO|nr:hypothetical protein DVK85_06960 [Flavobacterium arcticum]